MLKSVALRIIIHGRLKKSEIPHIQERVATSSADLTTEEKAAYSQRDRLKEIMESPFMNDDFVEAEIARLEAELREMGYRFKDKKS